MYKLLLSDTKLLYDVLNGFEMALCLLYRQKLKRYIIRGMGVYGDMFTLLKPIDLVGIQVVVPLYSQV